MITIPVALNTSVKTNQDGVPNVTNADVVAVPLAIPADAVAGQQYKFMADEYGDAPQQRWAKISTVAGDLAGAMQGVSVKFQLRVQSAPPMESLTGVHDVAPGQTIYCNILAHNPAKMPPPKVFDTNMIMDFRTA